MSRASDIAYAKICGFILDGGARPGAQLTEEQLSSIAGVSRTPVRDAVRRLESELILTRSESNRLFVAQWSSDEIDEMFTLRAMLEGHAAARAAMNISAAQIAELKSVNADLSKAIARSPADISGFLSANRRFHEIVTDAARSPRLSGMLQAIVEQPIVRRTALHYRPEELARSAHDHDEIIAAFEARDAGWAQSVMSSHIRRAFHSFSAASEHVAMQAVAAE